MIEGKGLTQKAAAEALGIPIPQMSRYLNGQTPDPAKLLTIAAWGGTTIEWLLTGKDLLLEIAGLGGSSGTTKSSPSSSKANQPEWKLLERAWGALDPVSRGTLLRIVTTVLEGDHGSPVQEHLQLIDYLVELEKPGVSRLARLRNRAAAMFEVFLLCIRGLEENDQQFVMDEFNRLHKQNALRFVELWTQKGLRESQQALKGRHERSLLETAAKHVRAALDRTRGKALSSEELEDICNELLAVVRVFRGTEFSVSGRGATELGRLKTTLLKELSQISQNKYTSAEWTKLCDESFLRLISPQKVLKRATPTNSPLS